MPVMCPSLIQLHPDLIRLPFALLKGRQEAVLTLVWAAGGGNWEDVATAERGAQTGGLCTAGVGFCRLKGGVSG
jgi:hypothetical protein